MRPCRVLWHANLLSVLLPLIYIYISGGRFASKANDKCKLSLHTILYLILIETEHLGCHSRATTQRHMCIGLACQWHAKQPLRQRQDFLAFTESLKARNMEKE